MGDPPPKNNLAPLSPALAAQAAVHDAHSPLRDFKKGIETMAKLTKQQTKMHNQACELLEQTTLTEQDKDFVFEHWHEGAGCNATESGSFFTPAQFASDFSLDVYRYGRVLDVCAGIGALSFFVQCRDTYEQNIDEIVCLELNSRFVEIGKKLLPEATWICADVFDLPELGLGHFDCIYGNPPFGKNGRTGHKQTRHDFELAVIDLASNHADYGAFIVPQNTAPFTFSGQRHYDRRTSGKGFKFQEKTGLYLETGVGIDTAIYKDDWKSTNIITEVVTVDFEEHRKAKADELKARAERSAAHVHTEFNEQINLF